MAQRKIPMRKDIVTGEMKPKKNSFVLSRIKKMKFQSIRPERRPDAEHIFIQTSKQPRKQKRTAPSTRHSGSKSTMPFTMSWLLTLITRQPARNCSEMENRQKVLQSLGLARRAKKLTTGIDLVIDQVRLGKAYLVFAQMMQDKVRKRKLLINAIVTTSRARSNSQGMNSVRQQDRNAR